MVPGEDLAVEDGVVGGGARLGHRPADLLRLVQGQVAVLRVRSEVSRGVSQGQHSTWGQVAVLREVRGQQGRQHSAPGRGCDSAVHRDSGRVCVSSYVHPSGDWQCDGTSLYTATDTIRPQDTTTH